MQMTMLHVLAKCVPISDPAVESWRIAMCQELIDLTKPDIKDIFGNTPWAYGNVASVPEVKRLFQRYGAYLERYQLSPGGPIATSATCKALLCSKSLEPL